MRSKYLIRTNEKRVFSSKAIGYTNYYTSSILELLKTLLIKRKRIIFITKWFFYEVKHEQY